MNLEEKTCTCEVWKMTEIPCSHALKFISHQSLRPRDFIPDKFLISKYKEFYSVSIPAICMNSLEISECLVPESERKRGRPKKKRFLSKGEGSTQKRQCSLCQKTTHDSRNCPRNCEDE